MKSLRLLISLLFLIIQGALAKDYAAGHNVATSLTLIAAIGTKLFTNNYIENNQNTLDDFNFLSPVMHGSGKTASASQAAKETDSHSHSSRGTCYSIKKGFRRFMCCIGGAGDEDPEKKPNRYTNLSLCEATAITTDENELKVTQNLISLPGTSVSISINRQSDVTVGHGLAIQQLVWDISGVLSNGLFNTHLATLCQASMGHMHQSQRMETTFSDDSQAIVCQISSGTPTPAASGASGQQSQITVTLSQGPQSMIITASAQAFLSQIYPYLLHTQNMLTVTTAPETIQLTPQLMLVHAFSFPAISRQPRQLMSVYTSPSTGHAHYFPVDIPAQTQQFPANCLFYYTGINPRSSLAAPTDQHIAHLSDVIRLLTFSFTDNHNASGIFIVLHDIPDEDIHQLNFQIINENGLTACSANFTFQAGAATQISNNRPPTRSSYIMVDSPEVAACLNTLRPSMPPHSTSQTRIYMRLSIDQN